MGEVCADHHFGPAAAKFAPQHALAGCEHAHFARHGHAVPLLADLPLHIRAALFVFAQAGGHVGDLQAHVIQALLCVGHVVAPLAQVDKALDGLLFGLQQPDAGLEDVEPAEGDFECVLRGLVLGGGDEVFLDQQRVALGEQLLLADQAFLGFLLGFGLRELLLQSEKFVAAVSSDSGLQLFLQLLKVLQVLLQAQASLAQGFLLHLHFIDGTLLEPEVADSDQFLPLRDGLARHFAEAVQGALYGGLDDHVMGVDDGVDALKVGHGRHQHHCRDQGNAQADGAFGVFQGGQHVQARKWWVLVQCFLAGCITR